MKRFSKPLRDWLAALLAQPRLPDPLDELDVRALADLPALHPQRDR